MSGLESIHPSFHASLPNHCPCLLPVGSREPAVPVLAPCPHVMGGACTHTPTHTRTRHEAHPSAGPLLLAMWMAGPQRAAPVAATVICWELRMPMYSCPVFVGSQPPGAHDAGPLPNGAPTLLPRTRPTLRPPPWMRPRGFFGKTDVGSAGCRLEPRPHQRLGIGGALWCPCLVLSRQLINPCIPSNPTHSAHLWALHTVSPPCLGSGTLIGPIPCLQAVADGPRGCLPTHTTDTVAHTTPNRGVFR
jgi:hypothetical protein